MLNLFPASGLDNSLFTAVLMGLVCLFLLSESLGWVFTGLVVPGYLASVIVIQPTAGAVILLEAAATYLTARGLSDWAAERAPWFRFFGRDRFFLILLSSIVVRLVFEAALLPLVGGALVEGGWAEPTLLGDLFSVGLIAVPLTANMLWKTGLGRGAPQVLLPTAAVYLALRFVLIPYTNLSITDFELSYENVALGFLSSPKTYIILLTAAFLAARTSVTWGWDSHGMLVLALMALAWMSPLKVLTTVAEVMILVAVARAVLAVPLWRSANLEGPRRILLVFGLGYALKFALCHFLAANYPGIKATDYFGFGYLLPALLALKVLQRGSAPLVLVPTLATSAAGLVVGTAIGLVLALANPQPVGAWLDRPAATSSPAAAESLVGRVHRVAGVLLTGPPARDVRRYAFQDHATWRRLVRALVTGGEQGRGEMRSQAASLGLELSEWRDADGSTFLILDEPATALETVNGWGMLVVRRDAPSGLVVQVPHPLSEPGTLVAAARLFDVLEARALLVSGIDPAGGDAGLGAVPPGVGTPYALARRSLAGQPALEVRLATRGRGSGWWGRGDTRDREALERVTGPLAIRDGAVPEDDVYGARPGGVWSRVDLSPAAVGELVSQAYGIGAAGGGGLATERGLSSLATVAWFQEMVAAWGYRAPAETELLFLDREVLAPLLGNGQAFVEDGAGVARLDAAAAQVGYRVARLTVGDGDTLFAVAERAPATLGWGTVLIRPSAENAVFLAVPRPASEVATLDLALHLMRDLDAACLVVAGADRDADPAGAANVLAADNMTTLFNHAHRVAYRELPGDVVGLQVRGFGAGRALDDPLILSPGVMPLDPGASLPGLDPLVRRMERGGTPVRPYDGSRELTPLRGTGNPEAALASNLDGRPYAILWASTPLRRRLSVTQGQRLGEAARAAGLAVEETWLDREPFAAAEGGAVVGAALESPPASLPPALTDALEPAAALARTGDGRWFEELRARAERGGVELRWMVDRETSLPTLLLRADGVTALVNPLTPDPLAAVPVAEPATAMRSGVASLVVVREGAP